MKLWGVQKVCQIFWVTLYVIFSSSTSLLVQHTDKICSVLYANRHPILRLCSVCLVILLVSLYVLRATVQQWLKAVHYNAHKTPYLRDRGQTRQSDVCHLTPFAQFALPELDLRHCYQRRHRWCMGQNCLRGRSVTRADVVIRQYRWRRRRRHYGDRN